jgi:hypothetical protein
MQAVEEYLLDAVGRAQQDPARGSKASKIAKALAPSVARRCF